MKIKAKQIALMGAFIVLTLIGYKTLPRDEIVFNVKENNNDGGKDKQICGDMVNVETIYVHIDGAVNCPGIKEVPIKTRLFELIEIADGEAKDADLSKLNLASILKDEQKVYVPYKIDINQTENQNNVNFKNNVINEDFKLININHANSNELQKLEGIGESMAKKIIDYRELNGLFNSIEEIKNVSGIGEAKYTKIKDSITI